MFIWFEYLMYYIIFLGFKGRVWIGATDEAFGNIFKWRTTGKSVVFTNWGIGQPSNTYQLGKGYEHCVEIVYYPDQGYRWNDYACVAAQSYMCERITPRKPPGTLTCTFSQ